MTSNASRRRRDRLRAQAASERQQAQQQALPSLAHLPDEALSKIVAALPGSCLYQVRLACRGLQRHCDERLRRLRVMARALSRRTGPALVSLLTSGALPNLRCIDVYSRDLQPGQVERFNDVLRAAGSQLRWLALPASLPGSLAVAVHGACPQLQTLCIKTGWDELESSRQVDDWDDATAPRVLSEMLQTVAAADAASLRRLVVQVFIRHGSRDVLDDAAWEAIGRLTQLTSLRIRAREDVMVTPELDEMQASAAVQSAALASLAPRLVSLDISNALPAVDLAPLTGLTTLKLEMSGGATQPPRTLGVMTRLEDLRVTLFTRGLPRPLVATQEMLAPLRQLRHVHLDGCLLDPGVARALAGCTALSALQVGGIALPSEPAAAEGAAAAAAPVTAAAAAPPAYCLPALKRLTTKGMVIIGVRMAAVAPALESLEVAHDGEMMRLIEMDCLPAMPGLAAHPALSKLSLHILHVRHIAESNEAATVANAPATLPSLTRAALASLPALTSLCLEFTADDRYAPAGPDASEQLTVADAPALQALCQVTALELQGLRGQSLASLSLLGATMPQLRSVTLGRLTSSAVAPDEAEQSGPPVPGLWPWMQAALALAALPRLEALTMDALPSFSPGGNTDGRLFLLHRMLDVFAQSWSLRRINLDADLIFDMRASDNPSGQRHSAARLVQDAVLQWRRDWQWGRGVTGLPHVELLDAPRPCWEKSEQEAEAWLL